MAGQRVGIFWKPTFYPNHRARNAHPGKCALGSILKRFGGALGSILKRFGGRLARYANIDPTYTRTPHSTCSFSGGPRRMCCNRSVVISWPSRDVVGIFWKPTFYPNHRARNPHSGDGPDPLLGSRIFRALRLGPFEGFPDGIARRLAKYANKDHQGWRLY